ncbi:MAG: nucleotidyltransferase domain-containing protein [Thermodesulfobacteriota bacterium]|nr:nucleotidyltransferase domain-containing protein [Bacillota bacterium]MDI7250163.1 nucleotidyltransferase domain-containing protein [Bacillota bacterium]
MAETEKYAPMLAILARYNPVAVYLFGSRAQGSARADSDIDLALLLPDDCSLPATERIDLIARLEELAGRRVDLVLLNRAPLPLQFEIIHTGIVLYESSFDARTDFEDIVVRDYLDLSPMLERSRQEIMEEAARGVA